MFGGGATKEDVLRMIKEGEEQEKVVKGNNVKGKRAKGLTTRCASRVESGGLSRTVLEDVLMGEEFCSKIAEIVASRLRPDMNTVVGSIHEVRANVGDLRSEVCLNQASVSTEIGQQFGKVQSEVIGGITRYLDREIENLPSKNVSGGHCGVTNVPHGNVGRQGETSSRNQNHFQNLNQDPELPPVNVNNSEVGDNTMDVCGADNDKNMPQDGRNPSFSLGLTHEGNGKDGPFGGESDGGQVMLGQRQSKRQKVVPPSLVGDYQCDKRLILRSMEGRLLALADGYGEDFVDKYGKFYEKLQSIQSLKLGGVFFTTKELADITSREKSLAPKVVDLLCRHIHVFLNRKIPDGCEKVVFFDTKFVALLMRNFSKFNKMGKKEDHSFPKQLLQYFIADNGVSPNAARFYLPFNFDKTHWVGLCVDCVSGYVYILDCDVSVRSDPLIVKEVSPVAAIFPYLLRQAGRIDGRSELKAFGVERLRNIPQNGNHIESGLTSILLLQAHAIGGQELCRCISPDVIAWKAQRLLVSLYEDNYEKL